MKEESIGNLIRKFRIKEGLSQVDLEVETGAASGSISRIESGKVEPSKETIKRIASTLKLSMYETALLFSLDINEYRSLINSINKIHTQKDIFTMLQVAVNECLRIFKLQGCSLFLIKGDELVLTVTGQSWYTEKAMKLLRLPFEKVRFSLTEHQDNALVVCATENRIVVSERLYECLRPVIPDRVTYAIEKLIGMKGFCNLPIHSSEGKVVGVLAISFAGSDVVVEKFPALLGLCDTITTALEKF